MKKTLALFLVSLFVFVGCNPTAPEPEVMTDDVTDEVMEATGISPEMAMKHDLTTTEVEQMEANGFTDDNLDAFIEETKSMGPGPFDFNAELTDVSGGYATGNAGAYFDEGYVLFAQFEGLPHPEEGFFYEGWVVRNSPLSVLSTGVAVRSLGDYHNNFSSDEDLLDHDFYVLTIEPDDGDPAPAAHILEGTMTSL